ncbi:MAG: protein kinase family protein [Humidesulfovibrio sp.]
MEGRLVEFLRERDYLLVRELGQGACGKTVLLYDDLVGEHYVCKKYKPIEHSPLLFQNFLREIRLLQRAYHRNIVRYFNCFVYPEKTLGYILMEFVDGTDIWKYVAQEPERINDVFLQSISGFRYLESIGVLHRDIRPQNILVSNDSVVKIIDLGFGKKARKKEDFDKSISLNWCCEVPDEFDDDIYDYRTEVYFVGKLFDNMIREEGIDSFAYGAILEAMCRRNPSERVASFSDVEKEALTQTFSRIEFTDDEKSVYKQFAELLSKHIVSVYTGIRYTDDGEKLKTLLDDVYTKVSLEDRIPDAAIVVKCFIHSDDYTYIPKGFPVAALKEFLQLLKDSSPGKVRIIMANLHTRLDAIKRKSPMDDVPF